MRKFSGLFWPVIARALRRAGGLTLAAGLIAVLNPFGILQWSEIRAREYWQQLYAPYYEPPPGSRVRDTRNDITVVMLDDAARAQLSRKGSIDAFDFAQIIDDLMVAGGDGGAPRAIFVDILLGGAAPRDWSFEQLTEWSDEEAKTCATAGRADQRSAFRCLYFKVAKITQYHRWKDQKDCQASTLAKVLCIERYGGTPVVFADATEPSPTGVSLKGEASPGAAALNVVGAIAPVRVDERAYPLAVQTPSPDRGALSFSPAALLYAAHCARTDCSVKPTSPDGVWSRRFASDVDVVWGVGRSESEFIAMQKELEGQSIASCPQAEPGRLSVVQRFFRMAIGGIHFDGDVKPAPSCPYTNAMSYLMLSEGTPQQARMALGGKIVMLGADLSDVNDRIPAAPYGAVPGVFYHAMALDNLLQRGPAYPKVAGKVTPWLDISWTDVASLLAVLLVTFLTACATGWLAARDAADGFAKITLAGWIRRLSLLAAVLVAPLVALFFMVLGAWLAGGAITFVPENFNVAAVALVGLIGLKDLVQEVLSPLWAAFRARGGHDDEAASEAPAELDSGSVAK